MDIDMDIFANGFLVEYLLGMFVIGYLAPKINELYDKYIGGGKK